MPYAVSHDGVRIHYEIVGEKKNPPLFLVMGLGMDSRGWMFQTPYFSKYFRVFLIDNRGVGKSDVPEGFFSTEDMAKDIFSVMEKEGVDKAHLVGASMGGMILQKFASLFPERTDKLVLACTLAYLTEHEKEIVKKGFKFIKGVEIDKIDENAVKQYISSFFDVDPERILNFMIKYVFSPDYLSAGREFILNFFREYIQDGFSIKGFLKQLSAVISHDSRDDLPKIKAGTLVITGDKDKMVPPEKSEYIASKIPNATLKIVKDGSHAFMFEKYEDFNREVISFLSEGTK